MPTAPKWSAGSRDDKLDGIAVIGSDGMLNAVMRDGRSGLITRRVLDQDHLVFTSGPAAEHRAAFVVHCLAAHAPSAVRLLVFDDPGNVAAAVNSHDGTGTDHRLALLNGLNGDSLGAINRMPCSMACCSVSRMVRMLKELGSRMGFPRSSTR